MEIREYLVSYGLLGDFGRFRPMRALNCRRGNRAIVRSHRGLELGEVLCPALPGHAQFLPNTTVGQLVRLATREDEHTIATTQARARQIFDDSRDLVATLDLPLAIIDAEVLLEGDQAIVHLLRNADCDVRPFVSGLSSRHKLQVSLQDLTQRVQPDVPEEHGCGKPGCGQTSGGGCSSCGSGGGCSTCGDGDGEGLKSYFFERRQELKEKPRVALL